MSLKATAPNVVAAINGMFEKNMEPRMMVAILHDRFGIATTEAALKKFYKSGAEERITMTQLLVQQQLGAHARNDVERLEEIRAEVQKKAEDHEQDPGEDAYPTQTWIKLKELEIYVISKRLQFAQLAPKNNDLGILAEASQRLHSRMASLIDRAGTDTVVSAACPDPGRPSRP